MEFFAGRFDTEVLALHVEEPFAAEGARQLTHSDLFERLRNFLPPDFRQLSVSYFVESGDPGTVIVDFARQKEVDLIMMPTHGRGAFRRFLLGSVTAKVLHDAPCPIWTDVRAEHAPPVSQLHCQRVVCGVEPREQDVAVIAAASQLTREFDGTLTVATAVPLPMVHTELVTATAGAQFIAAAVESARNELDQMLSEAHAVAHLCVDVGTASSVLRKVAGEAKADLLVIGRSQVQGVFGRLRADGYSIIRDAPCPVLSV